MITILMGKSASGKDTIAKALKEVGYEPLISCTTRPMREHEQEGVDYHFLSLDRFREMEREGRFIETRAYDVFENGVPSKWYYATPKRDDLVFEKDYVRIVDPDGCKSLIGYYGKENCFVVNVMADNATREARAMRRGSFDAKEWQRRMADDEVKFAEDIIDSLADCDIDNSAGHTISDLVSQIQQDGERYRNIIRVLEKNKSLGKDYALDEDEAAFLLEEGLRDDSAPAYCIVFYRDNDEDDYGWDFTLYDRDFHEIDGGVLENDDLTLMEALPEISILSGIKFDASKVVPTDYDWLFDRVSEVAEKDLERRKKEMLQGKSKSAKKKGEEYGD